MRDQTLFPARPPPPRTQCRLKPGLVGVSAPAALQALLPATLAASRGGAARMGARLPAEPLTGCQKTKRLFIWGCRLFPLFFYYLLALMGFLYIYIYIFFYSWI